MKGRFVLSLLLIFLATSVMAQTLPHTILGNKHRDTDFSTAPTDGQVLKYTSATGKWGPGSGTDTRIGTLTNTKWCYSDGSQVLCTQDAPAGAGDFLANGTVPMTGAIIPDSAGGQTVGTTNAEFGHIFLHNGKGIYFQADQSVSLIPAAGVMTLTAGGEGLSFTASSNLWTISSATDAVFTTDKQWSFTANPRIYDGSHYLTLDADGLTGDATITFGANTNNLAINNGTAVLDIAAAATLNIDTSLQVATGAVVLNGNAGGSSSLTLGNFALSLGGTMADGRICTYASSGTVISCNTATSTFQAADADLTTFAGLTATRGDILYVGEAGTWDDLAKGSANTVLYSDGTDVKYGKVTSAMITDNTITATDLAATLTFADQDFLDLSGITMSGTNDEGITLPFWADVTPASGSTKRFITWDESGSVLKIYTAGGWTTINPSAGAPTDVAYLVTGSLSGSLSAERLLAEGTGIDFTDAGANGNFTIAVDTTEIGTSTWGSGSEIVWTFNASGGTDPTLTFGNAAATFAGTFSATAFSGNITGDVTGNVSGNAGTASALAANPTDCSANQFATTIAANGNLTCAQPTPANLGAGTLAAAMTVGTGGSVAASGSGTITATNIVAGTGTASIAGPTDARIITVDDAAQTLAARNRDNTFTENNTFGNADTDTLTLRSLIVGGNSRAVWIAGSAPTPTYATGTNELYVGGDVESGGNVYAANFVSTGTGESYIGMANNASRSPTASAYEIYFEGAADLKFNLNGAEKTIARLEDAQTFTGAKTFTGGIYSGDASTAAALRLYDGSSNYWTITAPAMSGNYTLTLPSDDGTSGQYMKTDGSGNLSWDTPTASAAGSDTQVQFNDGGSALGGDAGFVFAKTTGTLTLGKNTVGGELVLYNELGATDYSATIAPNAAQAAAATITLPAATGTLIAEGLATGGIVLGDSTPDADGEIGYASNAYKLFANSEDLVLTASANLWTFSSATSATVAFTPSVALNGGASVGGTLALGANSITMSGSIGVTGTRVTKGWFTDVESTNMPTVGGTAILSSLTAPVFTTSIEAPFLILGSAATAADAGTIRMPNAGSIQFEADAAGTDINALSVDSSEIIQIGSAGASGVTITPATTVTGALTVGETNGLLIGATGVKITSDNDGAITFTGNSAGYDEDLTINLDDTENTAVFSSSTGVTKLDFSALNLATTGIITGAMNTNSDANGMSAAEMTTAGMYGTMFWATGAGTWALPGAATGMNFCVYSTTAAAVVINPDDGDTIVLNGTALSAGDSITSASGAGDFICLLAKDANTWYTLGRSGTWTDTN